MKMKNINCVNSVKEEGIHELSNGRNGWIQSDSTN
jgi:hypothetical protein